MQRIQATHFTDPGCPWAYSARPWHAKLRWRFGDQLDWRLVLIGLTESAEQYEARGYTPERSAEGYRRFADRFGMPFAFEPKARVSATSRGCRAVLVARDQDPELGEAALRALQFMQFTTTDRLEDDQALAKALAGVDGLDAEALVARLDDADVLERYESDRSLTRSAEGKPTHVQGRAANSDGPVRYTAPSVIFDHPDGRSLEVGGFQPVEAYDTALANLEPGLERRPAPEDPREALTAFASGLTTAEVAEVLRRDLEAQDLEGTRTALEALAADGAVDRIALGNDALWVPR